MIKARSVIDFGATYDVYDPTSGETLGALRRRGIKSMFKDEWLILDTEDTEIGAVKEDSVVMAMIRRTVGGIFPQKYIGEMDGEDVCTFKQNFNPFVQKIRLDFSGDQEGLLDRRIGIAAGVLLCAIEGRE